MLCRGISCPAAAAAAAPTCSAPSLSPQGPGKKWEHTETNSNGKPVRVPMHVRKGDTVKVIAGGDKGKVGTVLEINSKRGEVLVEGVNIKVRDGKGGASGEMGAARMLAGGLAAAAPCCRHTGRAAHGGLAALLHIISPCAAPSLCRPST